MSWVENPKWASRSFIPCLGLEQPTCRDIWSLWATVCVKKEGKHTQHFKTTQWEIQGWWEGEVQGKFSAWTTEVGGGIPSGSAHASPHSTRYSGK